MSNHAPAADFSGLVSTVYRCVQEDAAWAEALERLRAFTASNVGCLRIATKGSNPRLHLFAGGPLVDQQALDEWAEFRACELGSGRLKVGDVDVVEWANDVTSPHLLEMLQRFDIAATMMMCLVDDEASQITLNCSRGADQGKFTPADIARFVDIGGHFQRVIDLRRELTKARVVSQFQTQALDSLGIAAILVSQSHHVTPLNDTARHALEREIGLKQTSRGLAAAVAEDDPILRQAIKAALAAERPGESQAMSIHRDESFARVHLVIRSQTCPSLVSAGEENCALMFMRINEVVDTIDIKLLQQQFHFTTTEANVAVGLAQGLRLKDVEEQLNIRHNTARAHLRSMFSKADVERQSQLVSLLSSSLVPLGRDPGRLLQ